MQLYALGEIRSLSEGRSLIRRSFETKLFEPGETSTWDAAYARFQKILPT
jgi:rhamnulokinase